MMNKLRISLWILIVCTCVIGNSVFAQGGIARAPYSCDFENSVERGQWQFLNGNQANKWYVDTTAYCTGNYGLFVSNSGGTKFEYTPGSASYVWAYRQIALVAGMYDIAYSWKSNGYSNVHYMRAYLVPASSFTGAAGSGTGLANSGSPSGWIPLDGSATGSYQNSQNYCTSTFLGNVNVPTTGLYYIAFGWANTSYSLSGTQRPAAVDNIQISQSTCPRPDSISGTARTTSGDADITWREMGSAHRWIMEYSTSTSFNVTRRLILPDGATDTTGYPNLSQRITNLQPSTSYYFRIKAICDSTDTSMYSDVTDFRYCTNSVGCIDFTNLSGPGVVCTSGKYQYYGQYSGSYAGPYADTGQIDYGSDVYATSSNYSTWGSRHTVNTDPTLYDPICTQIPRIPPGECASVRLGSWYGGYICQSISYQMQVDTNNADILLFKYACIFNDVGHSSSQQPRFVLEILDQQGNLISPTCGHSDYSATDVSSGSVGGTWYNFSTTTTYNGITAYMSSIHARDWTPLGLSLGAYHGQTVTVRVTSFSCGQSGPNHCGYVYFTLGCTKARITSTSCGSGASQTTLTAPSGFNYRWYTSRDTTRTISTAQTVTVQLDSTMYYCEVSFVDEPSCKFTISTMASTRFPHAKFNAVMASDSCKYKLTFNNQSYVSIDEVDTNSIGQCEDFFWDFGDGNTSTDQNPVHIYSAPGTYTVTLISNLNSGACSDTTTRSFTFTRPAAASIIAPKQICFGDTAVLRTNDPSLVKFIWSNGDTNAICYDVPDSTTRYHVLVRSNIGCVDTLWHTVKVKDCNIYDTVCRNDRYISYNFNIPQSTIRNYADTSIIFKGHYRSAYGVDSTMTLNLMVWDTMETIVYDTFCTGDQYEFYNIPLPSGGVYSQRFANVHGCDSIIYLNLHEIHPPVLTLSHSYVPCFNYPITISAQSNGDYIHWTSTPYDSTLLGNDTSLTIVVRPMERTIYYATAGLDGYSCSTTESMPVNIEAQLEAYIRPSRESADIDNLQVVFTDNSIGNIGRQWYLEDYNMPVDTTRSYVYTFSTQDDSVKVLLVIYNEGNCRDTTSVIIPMFKSNLWAPTAFTPEEFTNNFFKVIAIEPISFELRIFNRYGVEVFYTEDPNEGWNGGVDNDTSKPCTQGAYAYRVIYRSATQPDRVIDKIGSVMLLR